MCLRALVCLAIFLCLSAEAAWAQVFTLKNIEVSLSEAMSKYSSKNFEIGPPQSSAPIRGRMRIETGNRHEVRVNALTTKHVGLEGFYTHQASNVVFESQSDTPNSLFIPLSIDHFGASLLYYPLGTKEPQKKWWPFVQAGGGAMIYRPTAEGQRIATDPLRGNLSEFFESSRPAINIGVGVKRSLGHAIGLRFDAGAISTKAPTFGLPYDSDLPNASVLPINSRITNIHASVGITFFLWRSR
jgi:hypothetical protein